MTDPLVASYSVRVHLRAPDDPPMNPPTLDAIAKTVEAAVEKLTDGVGSVTVKAERIDQ